jgi:hypothetical protein
MYFMGMFYLEHAEVVESYAQSLNSSKPNSKQKEKYLENLILADKASKGKLSTEMNMFILEEAYPLGSVPPSAIDIACGANMWAVVTGKSSTS